MTEAPRCPACGESLTRQCAHSCTACMGVGFGPGGRWCPRCYGIQLEPYYSDGGRSIYLGDCRTILPLIQAKVDVLMTDPQFFLPPVGHGARGDQEWVGSLGDLAMFEATFEPFFDTFKQLLGRHGQLYVNCHYRSYPSLYKLAYTRWPKVDMIVWYKPTGRIGRGWRHAHELILHASGKETVYADGFRLNIVGIMPVRTMQRAHPAEKPGELGDFLLEAVRPSGLMADPFMGSGGYLVAAQKRGLGAIGIEIEEKYCKIAAQRLAQAVLPLAPRPAQPGQAKMEEMA